LEKNKTLAKKKRSEELFIQSKQQLTELRKDAEDGNIILAYLDESGFDAVHPNQYAWTPKGERHLIQANRGERLNLLGALLSTGDFFAQKVWKSTTTDVFSCFISNLVEFINAGDKKVVFVLDNASIHTSKIMKCVIKFYKIQNVEFLFTPPYSPELNKIERLWHKMKYTWMTAKRRTKKELEETVDEIINGFGEKYKFNF
jgi:transposase